MATCPMCSLDVEDMDKEDGHDMSKHPEKAQAGGEETQPSSEEEKTDEK